ncbi:hypothetical protein Saso_17490 [Streptomyces asoensis]|uniref:Glutamine amidotransferase domain-containing protein n=1 Tax=Streptomyces asoensis TaxID=249586 RepID=A0ABQ3RW62_9ACTN|nr:hypothetical protein GCM10010496_35480 [Streptomyces asoensis]GHI60099.1 hypothetical protein Saso_17490 [Streptomyces asoensis]
MEGVQLPGARGWFTAVQRHPEDTAHEDPAQQGLFDALVTAALAGHRPPLPRGGRASGAQVPRPSSGVRRPASGVRRPASAHSTDR